MARHYNPSRGKSSAFTGGEKESLRVSLDRHRDVVLWKLDGLDDELLRRPMVPSGTSMLGLVKHLASVEYGWFCETFGRESDSIPLDEDDPDADLRAAPHENTANIVAYYGRARAAATQAIDEIDVEAAGNCLVRRRGVHALGAHSHDRGHGAPRGPHGHHARANRRDD